MVWHPHLTVACIVERENKFLCVEEKQSGKVVINQPAGHVEPGETLMQAALRETLEETQWHVELKAILGNTLFTSPANNVTYFRTTFIAEAVRLDASSPLDKDIERAVWLSIDELKAGKESLRSPMVLSDFERYLTGEQYPLRIIQYV